MSSYVMYIINWVTTCNHVLIAIRDFRLLFYIIQCHTKASSRSAEYEEYLVSGSYARSSVSRGTPEAISFGIV